MTNFDDLLQQHLEMLERDLPLEEVLAHLPVDQATELAPLLKLAHAVRQAEHPQVAPAISEEYIRWVQEQVRSLSLRERLTQFGDTLNQAMRKVYPVVVTFLLLITSVFMLVILPELDSNPLSTPMLSPTPAVTSTATNLSPTAVVLTPTPVTSAFTLSESALIRHGSSGEWDATHTEPGAILFYEGQYHLFRNGYDHTSGRDGTGGIAYLTSSDGVNWHPVGDSPVLTYEYNQNPFSVSSVLVGDDDQWVMYGYSWSLDYILGSDQFYIVRATAPAPTGPWVIDPQPLLSPSGRSEWDGSQITHPSVVRTEDGYLMAYAGMQQYSLRAIGLATSTDGINWVRLSDNPVLTGTSTIPGEGPFVSQPQLISTSNGYLMLYRTQNDIHGAGISYSFATSIDGLTWTRHPRNPILTLDDLPTSARGLHNAVMLIVNDQYHLYFSLSTGTGGTSNIWLAQFAIPFSP